MSVGVVLVIVPVAGEERAGAAGGGGSVVKLQEEDQELVPPAFTAFTRQKYVVALERAGVVNDRAVVLWFTTVVANVLTELTWTV